MTKRIMREFKLDEISGVTSPAQKHARAVIMKRDFSQEQRDRLANSGAAMEDGSFPIQNTKDLENAIHAIGRAKDPAKAKAHIVSRARALGATNLLPDGWVSKSNPGHDGVIDMTEAELKKKIDDAVATATADLNKKLTEANAEVEKMKKAAKKPGNAAEDALDGGADDAEETPTKAKKFAEAVDKAVKAELAKRDEIAKGDETFESDGVTIRKSEVGENTFKLLKSQAEKIEIAEFTKRAEGEFAHLPGETVAKAKAVRAVSKLGKEDREAVETMLKAGEKAMADAMKVIGKGGSNDGNTAESKLDALAKTHAETHKVDFTKAYNAVLETAEGRELYAQSKAERGKAA